MRDQRESRVTAPNVGVRFNVLDVCPGKERLIFWVYFAPSSLQGCQTRVLTLRHPTFDFIDAGRIIGCHISPENDEARHAALATTLAV